MDGRREARFQIYAPAKVTVLDTPEREMECLLLDISATGLKIVTTESLPVDEVIALEVEDHLVLADVRYAEPRGGKFTIGAERIHSIDKGILPPGTSWAEQIRFAVADYRSRMRLAIAGDKAQVQKQESELPVQHRDQVVEAAVQKLTEQWAKESEGAGSDGTLRAAIVDRSAGRANDRTNPPVIPAPPVAETQPGRPSWRLPVTVAGTIAAVVFSSSLFWSYRHSLAANPSQAAVVELKAGPLTSAVATGNAAEPGIRHAEIRVTEPTWVYAVADGKEVFGKLLGKDDTRQIDFAEKALVRVGNAGGVEIRVDGKPIGPLGPRGKIRAVEITRDGHRFIAVSEVAAEKR